MRGAYGMARLQVTKTDDRLVLSTRMDARRAAIGCIGFLAATLCLILLGALGLVFEATRDQPTPDLEAAEFLNPLHNHFGFLWLLGSLLLAAIVPFYLLRIQRSADVLSFDREEGTVAHNGRVVTRLPRIEFVRLLETSDTAGRTLYKLSLVHDDGHELALDESYDPEDVQYIGAEITDFLGVDLRRSP